MQFFKLLLILGVLGFGANHLFAGRTSTSASHAVSKGGFIPVAMPDGATVNEVLVIGPNCNSTKGQRTRAIAAQLAQAQIPHRHINSFSISNRSDLGDVQRLNEVMNQGVPVVLINGRGKANPTVEEIAAEYQKGFDRNQ